MDVPLTMLRRSLTHPKGIIIDSALGAGVVLLIWTAPDNYARLTAVMTVAVVGVLSIAMWGWFARKQQALEAVIHGQVDESMRLIAGIVDKLQSHPATSAEAQMALDGLRNIWGDEADRWFGRSGLN